jgi:hypothetical protein
VAGHGKGLAPCNISEDHAGKTVVIQCREIGSCDGWDSRLLCGAGRDTLTYTHVASSHARPCGGAWRGGGAGSGVGQLACSRPRWLAYYPTGGGGEMGGGLCRLTMLHPCCRPEPQHGGEGGQVAGQTSE